MKYVHILTNDYLMVINSTNGEDVKIYSDDPRYEEAIALVVEGKFQEVLDLSPKNVVTKFFNGVIVESEKRSVTVTVENGLGYVVLHKHNDMKVDLHPAITARMVKMNDQGFDGKSLSNFIGLLYDNPSETAVKELYGFIEACELPITEDGHFIAYKIIGADYKDVYSKTMDNSIGTKPSMPRSMVDTDRNNTCSKGLHFCSKSYLSHYGSSSRNTDRCMLVKINPADVVSIPSDYNNAKGRTWTYEVVGEVEGDWRTWLYNKDYSSKAVVANDGSEARIDDVLVDAAEDDEDEDIIVLDSLAVVPDCTPFYKTGYLDGYSDGSKKVVFVDRVANTINQAIIEYDNGYDLGYKHGRGRRAKLIK